MAQRDLDKIRAAIRQRKRDGYRPVKPRRQLGFVHHTTECIGCRACEIACKDKNDLPPGPRLRRVQYVEGGRFPNVFAYTVNMSCDHCAAPACVPTCPTGALRKREQDGIVDIDSTLCIGCRRCEAACPYGAPQFDAADGVMKKCNLCVDEIEAGRKPYCVMACMLRVLDVGSIADIRNGTLATAALSPHARVVDRIQGLADPALTDPSIGFVAHPKAKVEE